MKERLIQFIRHIGLRPMSFEKKVGLSDGFVRKVGDSIRKENLDKISTIYPELNIAWLQTGEGEMLKCDNAENPKNNDDMNDVLRDMAAVIKNQSSQIDRLITEVERSGQRADRMLTIIEGISEKGATAKGA